MLSQQQTEKLIALVTELLASDEQFSASLPLEPVAREMLRPGIGLAELMQVVVDGYADRPVLARRATELVEIDGRVQRLALPRYESITYRELGDRVIALAATWRDEPVRPGDRIATLGAPSIDYTVADMAIARLDGVSVPLHAGVPLKRLQPVVDETEPTVLAASVEHLGTAAALSLASSTIRRLVVLDHDIANDDHRDALAAAVERLAPVAARLALETMAGALVRGADLPAPPVPSSDPRRLAAIIYTSGSSGSPKGAMLPDRLVTGAWSYVAATFVDRGFALPAITLNYLPMSHTGGRAMLFSSLGAGGCGHFPGSTDLSTMLEDLALVRPTQLNFIPRVWELLHAEYQSRMVRGGASSEEILAEMRTSILGGRYITALTGSAPISPDLAAWVEELLDTHLIDALGATESGGVIIDGALQRPPITDYRLDDVPELGYFGTDRPHPRGELLIKSTGLFAGYYRRDDLTVDVFDDEGFYRTGDIVAELGPDEVRYLDRRNNVIKLSHGEFVTISKLETLFAECHPVEQIYLYGNGERAYLLAVVVPTADAVDGHGDDVGVEILRTFQEAANRSGLEPYEVPRDVIISPTPFTAKNGLMTATDKPARRELRERFGEQLEARYAEHDEAQDAERRALLERAPRQPTLQTVREAAAVSLGKMSGAPSPDDRYTELGGDSLAAVSYASLLSDILEVEVDVGVVISPANDLRAVAAHIEARRAAGGARATFASVHGAGATVVAAADLTLDRFVDEATLAGAASLSGPAAEIRHVLLTGATGYLGRYLALEWLERMAAVEGTVTCLVRAKDDDAARHRLDRGFDTGDGALLDRYRMLADHHLQVVAGDKSEPLLGVGTDDWQRLADDVDVIVDPAALVNHVLPYPQLFGPNVVGTAELIRLALTTRQKPIIYVSSMAAGLTAEPDMFTEDVDVRVMCPTKPVDDGYASGYATSKWAGEVLLREAHELCGLPVRVFRCDMLMAETTYRGQLNLPDMVTRLLFSVAVTGLAPVSFYAPGPDGGRARSHFDGLPVDFVAEAIATVGSDLSPRLRTYHVVNPHDDGIGLDEYVDWLAEVRPVVRISDHERWFARFESAIRNLPERQRHASLLPIVETYRFQLPPMPVAVAPSDRFAAAVASDGVGDGRIPGIDKPIIEKYLSDLEHLGLL